MYPPPNYNTNTYDSLIDQFAKEILNAEVSKGCALNMANEAFSIISRDHGPILAEIGNRSLADSVVYNIVEKAVWQVLGMVQQNTNYRQHQNQQYNQGYNQQQNYGHQQSYGQQQSYGGGGGYGGNRAVVASGQQSYQGGRTARPTAEPVQARQYTPAETTTSNPKAVNALVGSTPVEEPVTDRSVPTKASDYETPADGRCLRMKAAIYTTDDCPVFVVNANIDKTFTSINDLSKVVTKEMLPKKVDKYLVSATFLDSDIIPIDPEVTTSIFDNVAQILNNGRSEASGDVYVVRCLEEIEELLNKLVAKVRDHMVEFFVKRFNQYTSNYFLQNVAHSPKYVIQELSDINDLVSTKAKTKFPGLTDGQGYSEVLVEIFRHTFAMPGTVRSPKNAVDIDHILNVTGSTIVDVVTDNSSEQVFLGSYWRYKASGAHKDIVKRIEEKFNSMTVVTRPKEVVITNLPYIPGFHPDVENLVLLNLKELTHYPILHVEEREYATLTVSRDGQTIEV